MSQTKLPRAARTALRSKREGRRIRVAPPKESSSQTATADEATRLRHEIAILESKKRILKTLDALGA
ncbi:hypothetical protein [Corynebacterium mayonis]|uniref:hypothetical protein n=1 Tax=Corynebacterium mayonis TaxID=3062461 RepID=UPI0031402DC8